MNTSILISKCHRFADRFMHYWWCYPLIALFTLFILNFSEEKTVTETFTIIILIFFAGISVLSLFVIIVTGRFITFFKEQTRADAFMRYWWCYPLISIVSFNTAYLLCFYELPLYVPMLTTSCLFAGASLLSLLVGLIQNRIGRFFKERTRADAFMRYWWCYPLICIGSLVAILYLHLTYPKITVLSFMTFILFGCLSLLALFIGVMQNRIGAFFQRHKAQIAYWNRRYLGWMLPLLTTLAGLWALSFTVCSLLGIIFLPILLLALVIHLLIGLKQKRFAATFKTIGLFAGSLGLSLGMLYGPLLLCVGMYMNEDSENINAMSRAAYLKYVEGKEFVIPDFVQYNILEYATLQFPQLDVAKNGQKVTLQGEEYWEIPVSYEGMPGVDKVVGTPKVYFTMDGTAVGLRRDDYKWDLTTLVPDNQNKLLPHIANFTLAFFTNSGKAPKSIAIGVGNLIE